MPFIRVTFSITPFSRVFEFNKMTFSGLFHKTFWGIIYAAISVFPNVLTQVKPLKV
jgi:hypothetical protein